METTLNANVDRAVHFLPCRKTTRKANHKKSAKYGWIRARGDSVIAHSRICPGNQRIGVPRDRAALFLDGIWRVSMKF